MKWFCKSKELKKPKVSLKTRTKEFEYFENKYNVGVALIELTFDDSSTFEWKYYGYCDQCKTHGNDEKKNYNGIIELMEEPKA